MPAKSEKQRRLMSWVYACKTGKTEKCPSNIKKIAKGISATSAKHFMESPNESEDVQDTLTFKRFLQIIQ